LVATSLILFSVAGSQAQLLPGGSLHDPATGTTPYFSTSLPTWFTLGNQLATMTDTWVPTTELNGTLKSTVYKDSLTGQLGFDYVFTFTGGTEFLSLAQFLGPTWHYNINILSAGADASGSSTGVGTPSWSDGDPYDIRRDVTGNLIVDFSSGGDGTILDTAGQKSARIFITTASGTMFTTAGVKMLNTGADTTANAYVPVVPEPGIALLWGIGSLVLWVYRQRSQVA
jgi:hypothetical protein